MTRTIRRARLRLAADDRGIAIVTVMAMVMVVSVLVVAIFSRVLNEQRSVVRDRDVTTAREAAEAGLDEVVFMLGQGTNYSTYPTTYASTTKYVGNVGGGSFSGNITVNPANAAQLIVTMQGTYPTGSGKTRTVQAVVQRQSPPAFDYSMFASTKITIHRHDTPLSPDVLTTKIHSNGDIAMDGPSQYKLESMSAVGAIDFAAGFTTKDANGNTIPSTGYNWTDPLPPGSLCFPGRTPGACTASSPKYKAFASVTGDIFANTVTVDANGQTLAGTAETTLTGQVLPATAGNIKASSIKIGATTYSTPGNPSCAACNKGAASLGGQVGGGLTVAANYAPAVIPFPALNYQATYKVRAQQQAAADGKTHVFTSPTTFLDYITTPANGFYYTVNGTSGALSPWTTGMPGIPRAIVLEGDWYLTTGSLSLDWADMLSRAKSKTGVTTMTQAPTLIIRGSLLNETGSIDITTPLAMVGAGNPIDFLRLGTNNEPSIDLGQFLSAQAIEPAVLASGGNMHADDCDTDGPWTSPSTYEPLKTCPIYVRGLVYSAAYNATAKTAVPSDQHWHNSDPKNLVKIFGAQVGDTLHDCSNFSFTYDPLVKRAFGFSGSGTVAVQDFRELGA